MTRTTRTRTAYARRTDGDLYTVTYSDSVASDRDVPWSYLRGLLRRGYTVEVDQTTWRGEGEPARQTYTPDMA